MEENFHKDHRKRVRAEFREVGLKHWEGHRVLEMLLFYSMRQGDTNETAHRLYESFGHSLSSVFDADFNLLKDVKGVGEESATLIKFISGIIKQYMDDHASKVNVLSDFDLIKEYMRYKFLGEINECVLMVCLNAARKVVYCGQLAEGSSDTVAIQPSAIVKMALRAGASKAILAHNHPGGICLPSNADLRTTSIFFDELRRVDVEMIDHIIVAPDGVYSMAENGMLPKSSHILL